MSVLDEQGSLEIVGHRAGTAKSSPEGSKLSAAPASALTAQRKEGTGAAAAKADASAAGAAVQGRAAAAAADLAGSREDEDRVMLAGSGDGSFLAGRRGRSNGAGGKGIYTICWRRIFSHPGASNYFANARRPFDTGEMGRGLRVGLGKGDMRVRRGTNGA